MEPTFNLLSSLWLLGAAQGVFLALTLVNIRGGNAVAHRLLALLTLTFAADLGVDFLRESLYLVHFPQLIFIEGVTSFLYGPLAYLYVCALTARDGFHFSLDKWWHFLPFVLSAVLLVPFYRLSGAQILELVYFDADPFQWAGLWAIAGLFVELLPIPLIGTYLSISVIKLVRHSREIRERFSSIERISLTWLRNLLIALGLLYFLYLFAVLFSAALNIGPQVEVVLGVAMVVVIYSIGYLGIRQPVIFAQHRSRQELAAVPADETAKASTLTAKKKYQKSALDGDMSSALLAELERHMATSKPHLDSGLSLAQLSEQLGISSNYLSQVINEQTGGNFFDFINQHRVAVAKELLQGSAQSRINILNIAMDAGFNSKSAFYTAFKRHTHLTPSQFRKSPNAG